MKKRTKILLISILSLFLVIILTGILFVYDALPAGMTATINRMFSFMHLPAVSHQDDAPLPETEFIIRTLPENMHGVWMDLNTDLKTDPGESFSAIASETSTYFNCFKNVLGDTIFVTPELSGRYASMKDSYGSTADLIWEVLGYADLSDYFKVLVVPDALLYDRGGNLTTEQIDYYLNRYTFHAVLLDSETMRANGDCAAAAAMVGERLAGSFPNRYLGLMLYSDAEAAYATDDTRAALAGGYVQFTVVDAGGAMNSAQPFRTVMHWWNTFAADYRDIPFYCRHRNDYVLTGGSEWSNHLEICEQLRVLWNCENIRGSVFCGAAALLANKSNSTQRLSYLLFDGMPEDLKVKNLSVDAENAQVSFSGTASASYKLLCNREVLAEKASSFDNTFPLAEGDNAFSFFNAGRLFTYRIFNNTPAAAAARAQEAADAVTPYTDNGLGSAVMCRVLEKNTETLGSPTEKDSYHADYSTLAVGTLDYLASVSFSDERGLRYELASGNTVFAVNCELISGAYSLPQNHLAITGVDDTDSTKTVVALRTDWMVPVNLQCLPQSYAKGYRDYNFNISAFTASYVDVRFSHTADLAGTELLTFAANAPFYASEVFEEEDAVVLRLHLRKTGQFYGFHVERDEEGRILLSFKKHADGNLQGKTVMLDPGHGGFSMTGTALADEAIPEKQVTLSIALKAKQILESYGATVLMTRFLDTPLTLEERCAILWDADPDVFVSIHCDGADNKSESGTHTFYFRPYSMPLASAIHQSMVSEYRTNIYKPTDTNYANIDRGIKYYPFFVTRMDNCPSVLCETGFMTNQTEGHILVNDNYQYWMAQGIANGIRDYFMMNY